MRRATRSGFGSRSIPRPPAGGSNKPPKGGEDPANLKDKTGDAYRLFESFLELANIGDLHPKDLERWRAFVIQTHLDGTQLYDADVSDAIHERFPAAEDFAVKMGGRFVHERELLRQYDKQL